MIARGRQNTLRTMRFPTEAEAYDMCCAFTKALSAIYPGHMWRAMINQDMLWIQAPDIDADNALCVNLGDIDVEGKVIMRAGGEILERYGLKRGEIEAQEYAEIARDFQENAIQQ